MLVSDKTIDAHKKLLKSIRNRALNAHIGHYRTYDESNPFSKILRGESQTELVDETPYAITIKNANQRTDTYNLVIPVYPAADLLDLLHNAPEEHKIGYYDAIAQAVQNIHPKHQTLTNELNGSCARVLFNIGPYSQNTVNQCHAHVTGDNEPLKALYLLLSEAAYNRFDESVYEGVQNNHWNAQVVDEPFVPIFAADYADGVAKTGKIYHYDEGFKFGVKETVSLVRNVPDQQKLKSLKEWAYFLTAFNQMSMCTQNGQGNWGGRLVIDTPVDGPSVLTAASGARLKKLPQTPLTVGQQKDYFTNLVSKAKENIR